MSIKYYNHNPHYSLMNFLRMFLKNGGPHKHLSATLHRASARNVIDSSKYRIFDKRYTQSLTLKLLLLVIQKG